MSSVTGSVADALSPNPPPHAFAWASLQAAVNCPGSFPNPTTAPQGLRTRAPCCALCLSGSLEDSEVKRGAGAGDWCAEKSGPSQLPEGPAGGGGLPLQPWPARSPGPEGHPPPPAPASRPCSSQPGPPSVSEPDREPERGGCFPARWTKRFWCFQEGTEHSVHVGTSGILDGHQRALTRDQTQHAAPSLRAPRPPRPAPRRLPRHPLVPEQTSKSF